MRVGSIGPCLLWHYSDRRPLRLAMSHPAFGIYEYPPAFHTTIVVTSELPREQSTIWLRLLGRGPTQRDAIDDLMALPANHPQRGVVIKQLQDWYHVLLRGEMGCESVALMKSLSKLKD